MLRETPVHLRRVIVIGLGNVGKITTDRLSSLLDSRLGGVPIIGLVTVEPDYASSANAIHVTEIAPSHWHVRLPMGGETGDNVPTSRPLGTRLVTQDKPDTGVLDTTSDPTQLRRNGRQAIRRWGDSLQRLIETVQSNIGAQDNLTALRQQTEFQARVDETGLEVFIIGALDEPFASGAFLDLAYLIDWILSFEGGARFHYDTNGILFLPNYRWDGADVSVREADTYAALKELDYYTSQRRYTSDYRTRLDFTRGGPPFNRSCYLVETTNEELRSLPDLEQLSAMVAEWLYRCLTTSLMAQFRQHGSDFAGRTSEGRVTAYSGLGTASFVLPIDEAIEVCGARLGAEIVRNHLQREVRGQEQTEPMGRAQTYAGAPVSNWLEEELRTPDTVSRFLDVDPRYFDNISLSKFQELRDRLCTLCGTQRLSQALPSIRGDLQKRAEDVLERVRQHLPGEVRSIVDGTPDGGLDRSQIFLEKLRDAMADRERQARQAAKRAHDLERRVGDDIARARAQYQSATQMMMPRAIVGIMLAGIVTLGLLVYASNILFKLLPAQELEIRNLLPLDFRNLNILAGVLLIIGHVLVGGVVFLTTQNWMSGTKQQYINRHRERLEYSLEKAQQDLRARFYHEMQRLVNDEIVRLTDFRDLIERLGEALREECEKPCCLYGMLRFPLEESVLTPEDVEDYYREITRPGTGVDADGLDDFLLKLARTHGPVSSWAVREVGDLCAQIVEFGKRQMEELRRRKSAEQMLISHLEGPATPDYEPIHVQIMYTHPSLETEPSLLELPPLPVEKQEALRDRAKELFARGTPFLRYNKTEIQPDVDTPLICLLGTHSAGAETTPLNRVITEYFGHVQCVATLDPHTLVAMSVRHGMPLYALGMAKRYRSQYERCFRDKLLHTRRDHMALPDLFPLPSDVLEPQMAVALGCAVKPWRSRATVILHDPGKGYFFVHRQPGRPDVEVPLGGDKLDACIYLQHNDVDLRRVSKQIDDAIVEQAERLKSGNQAVINKLRAYLQDNVGELEEWEVAKIERYIERLH